MGRLSKRVSEVLSALLCFLYGFGIAVLEACNLVINCIITVPECGLPTGTKLSYFINYCLCSAHFSKGKMLYFPLAFCVFSIQTVHLFNSIIRVCIILSS